MKCPAYPKYKDSGVQWLGGVPEHWEVKRLKHIAQVRQGVTKGRDLEGKATIELPYLRVANVQDGYLDLEEIASIAILHTEIERYALQHGDVLMNEGGDNDKLGRGAIWNEEIKPCIHQNHVFCVRPNKLELSTWISLWTQSSTAKAYFLLRGKQTTNLASISSTSIRELPLPLPPLPEQTAIADFLDQETGRIDTLVAKKRRLIALLGEKRTALISRTVTRGLPAEAARELGLEPNTRFKDSGIEWLGRCRRGGRHYLLGG
ncbi:MAG: restriction endonuclease subunit S [Desulfobulbus sp.]|nr:restriction endonuclease subunit S [Desulfobulbus sp.]